VPPHVPPQPWTYLPPNFPSPILGPSFPSFTIISGTDCNHGPSMRKMCRVRVAYSLADVQRCTAQGMGLTVALTQFHARARDEVETRARILAVLTVNRSEKMCTSCAVKLGWAVGALLVIG